MTAPIGSVDNQIVADILPIGQAALDDTSDDRRHLCRFGDGIVGPRALKALISTAAMNGPDGGDEHSNEARLKVHDFGQRPLAPSDLEDKATVPEFRQ